YDATPPAAAAQAPTVPAAPAVKPRAGGTTPPTLSPVPPRAEPMPAPTKTPAPPAPPTPIVAPAPGQPVAPPQPGPPSRPAWAPKAPAEPAGPGQPQAKSPSAINVPSWAPRVPLAAEPGTPTWFSPKEQVPHTTSQPAVQPAPAPQPAPSPTAPVAGGQLPVAKVPPAPAQPAQPASAQPTAWQVVDQPRKSGPHAKADAGPTAEDRSYAEWFAWAKRGGAPASACHAAAQGAFKALSTGKDVTTAVQWATAAMS